MNELTPRQHQILALIQRHLQSQGVPPTRAEIARTLGFRSVNAAEQHLRALARKGVIELRPHASRGIRVLVPMTESEGLPLVGRVAAGSPILAAENTEGRYRVDPDLFRPAPDYLLRVRGMSMYEAGILEDDLVAVHRQPQAVDGQIVVARIEDEVTVKRFRRRGARVWLLPENPAFFPIEVDLRQTELTIEGVVVGVIRRGVA